MGQRIKVFTDHKNLVHESELKTTQRVMRWRLLFEEYGPEIEYIKGLKNVVADALNRLPKQGDIVDDVDVVLPFVPGSCGKSVIFPHLVGFHSSRQNIY